MARSSVNTPLPPIHSSSKSQSIQRLISGAFSLSRTDLDKSTHLRTMAARERTKFGTAATSGVSPLLGLGPWNYFSQPWLLRRLPERDPSTTERTPDADGSRTSAVSMAPLRGA